MNMYHFSYERKKTCRHLFSKILLSLLVSTERCRELQRGSSHIQKKKNLDGYINDFSSVNWRKEIIG